MNEEEKESIEEFRKQLRLAINIDDVTTVIRNDNAQTILNLIEKQQKEIEELKQEMEKRKWVRIKENGEVEPLLYISKDKIRDKIRHYQELQDNYIKKYDEINEGLQAMINVLQELIEEREEKKNG